jgi:hypothetical protein
MKKAGKIFGFVVAVLMMLAGSVRAELITIKIKAEVSYVVDQFHLFDGQIVIGTPMTGWYTYDSTISDYQVEQGIGMYWNHNDICGIFLKAGGFTFQTDPDHINFLIGIQNENPPSGDSYWIYSYNNLSFDDNTRVLAISWQLDDNTGTALSSDVLPTTAPVLGNWNYDWGIRVDGDGFDINAKVISAELVPEPATLLLLGMGSLLLRRQNKP